MKENECEKLMRNNFYKTFSPIFFSFRKPIKKKTKRIFNLF